MKTNSSIFTAFSAALFGATIFFAVPVSAIEGSSNTQPTKPRTTETNQQAVFCKSFDTITTKTVNEITKRDGTSRTKWQQTATDIKAKRAEWAAKVAATRTAAEAERVKNFEKLEAIADTETEKEAVNTYKDAVLAAVAKRQAAYDANFEAYFTAVNALLTSQKTDSSGDATAFKAAVTAAVNKAKASCASGASAEQVKKQLGADLKAAKEAYKNTRSSDRTAIKSQLEALKKTRKDANEKARAEFKTSLETARTTLKAAFAETEESV